MSKTQPQLFEEFAFTKGIGLRNRIVMARQLVRLVAHPTSTPF